MHAIAILPCPLALARHHIEHEHLALRRTHWLNDIETELRGKGDALLCVAGCVDGIDDNTFASLCHCAVLNGQEGVAPPTIRVAED